MIVDFQDLKTIAEQDCSSPLAETLNIRARQYQDVIPEEILDLLEEAIETYRSLASELPCHLRKIAQKEIEFLFSVYEDKIRNSVHIPSHQVPHKLRELLSITSSRSK